MDPIQFQGYNRMFVLDGCFDLPAKYEFKEVEGLGQVHTITTVWQLTTEELMDILHSGQIMLSIISENQPPVMLAVVVTPREDVNE
jgi:uncharacterized OB-fold protein